MTNKNFKWLTKDIDSTLTLKVVGNENGEEKNYGSFNILEVLETDGDRINIATANIDDLTNLLTLGIVRFTRIDNRNDVLDIPFRNLYLLYKNASVLEDDKFFPGESISFKELELFAVINGEVRDDLSIYSYVVDKPSEQLIEVMKIAYHFRNYSMHNKFDALNRVTIINHRRLIRDNK